MKPGLSLSPHYIATVWVLLPWNVDSIVITLLSCHFKAIRLSLCQAWSFVESSVSNLVAFSFTTVAQFTHSPCCADKAAWRTSSCCTYTSCPCGSSMPDKEAQHYHWRLHTVGWLLQMHGMDEWIPCVGCRSKSGCLRWNALFHYQTAFPQHEWLVDGDISWWHVDGCEPVD